MATKSTIWLLLALSISITSAKAAPVEEEKLRADCKSVHVPDDQLPDCVAALSECIKSKTLKQCEAEIFSPDEGTPD
jgi:hypothetical protein